MRGGSGGGKKTACTGSWAIISGSLLTPARVGLGCSQQAGRKFVAPRWVACTQLPEPLSVSPKGVQ